ncbi:hypothetical protein CH35J_000273 [Colletotrichum higginsianum]|uniref:Uncharacterized protein n=1 Tax=Colletotrichum higginsianum TaxID=80884 RepID=A0A4T0WIG8_9PEZI|nr:hypothetical protein CH35J_000273 [Colletotrichum higginsianum]
MTRQRHLALQLAAALALLAAVLPGARVAAVEDLEAEDVPPECAAACTPIVQLTGRCEAQAEQRFGTDRRRSIGWRRAAVDGPEREARRRWRKRRSLQRTLGTRLGRRQREEEDDDDVEDGDEDDDSDDEEEGARTRTQPAPGRIAETERSKAADEAGADAAMRACVCGERGFDVAGVAFGCAACVARNGTAVEANEDIRQIIAECGFVAAPAPPVLVTTTTPPVLVPATSTLPPPVLAPGEPSTLSSSTSTSATTPPPAPPQVDAPPSTQSTSIPPPAPPATQTPSVPTTPSQPAEASSTQSAESVTPVTVFETPTFVTLPSIVRPNDAPASPPDLGDGNQMSHGARRMGVPGRGVVLLAVVVFLLI